MEAGEVPFPLQFVRFHIGSWEQDSLIWPVLLEMCEEVIGSDHWDPTLMGIRWLENRVQNAFKRGWLLLVQEGLTRSGGAGGAGAASAGAADQAPADIPPPPPPPETEKTWFHAKLLDENGQPMAKEDYIVVGSDGVTRKGKLDGSGEVYIPSILPHGNCTITFPNIHLNPLKKKK